MFLFHLTIKLWQYSIFSVKKKSKNKGYYPIQISNIEKLNSKAVSAELDIPTTLKSKFQFELGQYVNVIIKVNDEEHRRSYSICSHPDEILRIAVKRVETELYPIGLMTYQN